MIPYVKKVNVKFGAIVHFFGLFSGRYRDWNAIHSTDSITEGYYEIT